MKLREIAHSRTGDKGNISNISLIAFEDTDYEMLRDKVTAVVVKEWFKDIVEGDVVRYELPKLNAFNFVLYGALGGGVTKSLAQDMHGKSFSSKLLDLEI
ncbi:MULTISPECIES: AtuA-related protein [unclassified Psychrobacter]|uniref:AtuA-related protein n=1 Tax=unclassified Psychrobacter TaxID=196806 RepID=UPI00402B317A